MKGSFGDWISAYFSLSLSDLMYNFRSLPHAEFVILDQFSHSAQFHEMLSEPHAIGLEKVRELWGKLVLMSHMFTVVTSEQGYGMVNTCRLSGKCRLSLRLN